MSLISLPTRQCPNQAGSFLPSYVTSAVQMVMVVSVAMAVSLKSSVHMLGVQPWFIVMTLMVVMEAAECNGVSGL